MPDNTDEKDAPKVAYIDKYDEKRAAHMTDPDYDPAELWEGTEYEATDVTTGLRVGLWWDAEAEEWSEPDV